MTSRNLIKDNLTYSPEIDGLRAIAVLAVVLFHFDLLEVSGGFVGVDVFFVISGFLISSIVLNQIEQRRFSVAEFYTRRARRILPALSVMLLFVIVVGWFFLLPMAYTQLGKSLVSVCVFSANIFFWRTFDYFGPSADETPLLHCWSLAVEEQFYFVLPLVLVLTFAVFSKSSHWYYRSLIIVMGVTWCVSLASSQYFLSLGKQQAVFYLLPTRAWELLTGTLVALMPIAWIPAGRWRREVMTCCGVAAILIPCFTFDTASTFPGLLALPPCLGTACVIMATANDSLGRTAIGRLLATRPLRGCGLISYSLYLWHWPIWVFARYYEFEPPTVEFRLAAIVLTVVAGWLSWRFVEQPFRSKSASSTMRPALRWAACSIGAFLVLGLVLIFTRGVPARFPAAVNKLLHVSEPWGDQSRYELSIDDVRNGRLISLGDREQQPAILLWGDSHAIAAMPAVEELCHKNHVAAVVATHSSTIPVLEWVQPVYKVGLGKDAPAFNAAVLDFVKNKRIKHVLLVAAWQGCVSEESRNAVILTVKAILQAGATPWFVTQVPRQPFSVPKALARMIIWGESDQRYRATESAHPLYGIRDQRDGFLESLEEAGALVIDTRTAFWDESTDSYIIEHDGQSLYHDTNHLTPFAAKHILAPVLNQAIHGHLISPEPTEEIRNSGN